MDRDIALKASEILSKIKDSENRIAKFYSTREFCSVVFRGENGNEKLHEFTFETSPKETREIRKIIGELLQSELSSLNDQLKTL